MASLRVTGGGALEVSDASVRVTSVDTRAFARGSIEDGELRVRLVPVTTPGYENRAPVKKISGNYNFGGTNVVISGGTFSGGTFTNIGGSNFCASMGANSHYTFTENGRTITISTCVAKPEHGETEIVGDGIPKLKFDRPTKFAQLHADLHTTINVSVDALYESAKFTTGTHGRINVLEGADPHTVLPGPVKIKTGTHGKVDGCGNLSVRDLRVQTGTHGSVSNIMITKQAMLEAGTHGKVRVSARSDASIVSKKGTFGKVKVEKVY
jgi:hypothetical protein